MRIAHLQHIDAVESTRVDFCYTIVSNKTRQGYVRKHILKPAGYFFVGQELAGDLPW
jgi:hypothetical protein